MKKDEDLEKTMTQELLENFKVFEKTKNEISLDQKIEDVLRKTNENAFRRAQNTTNNKFYHGDLDKAMLGETTIIEKNINYFK